MRKTEKTNTVPKTGRSAQSGKFLGRTQDGLLIPKPDFKPKSFTIRELDEAVRSVKRRQTANQAG